MKRFFTYIFIVAAIAFAASCTMESFQPEEDGDGFITLTLKTSEMSVTRADDDTETMESIENKVTHADFFFFEDEAGTKFIDHKRLEVKEGELVPVTGQANLYTYTFDVRTDTHDGPLQGPSYVYVIANYPEEISETTLEGILGLDIKTDLSGEIEYFVMDSYNSETEEYMTYLSPSKAGDSKTYTIGLTRCAAKLILNFNVKDSYTDEFDNEWIPETSQMWVNFVNSRKNAVVEAAPVEFSSKDDFFTTEQKSPVSAAAAKTGYTSWTTDAVYTYPQAFTSADVTAPYFKLYCPWKCLSKGMNNFYYKILIPKLESFKRNTIYTLTVDVSIIGGTEDDWALVADFVYVANWFQPDAVHAEFESALYLDVPVKEYKIYGIDQITVPVVSSNDIKIVSAVARQQKVTETLTSNYTKIEEDTPIEDLSRAGRSCVANGKESFTLTYKLDSEIDLTTYNSDARPPVINNSFDCSPIEWTVTICHVQEAPCLPASQTVSVKIIQYPSIYAKLITGGDSFVNGYYSLQTGSVSPKPDGETRYRNNGGTGNTGGTEVDNNGPYYRFERSENPMSSYGRLNTTVQGKPNTMTLVTVTAFSDDSDTYTVVSNGTDQTEFDYIIGDPRVPWTEGLPQNQRSLDNYLWGNTTRAWQNVSDIMVSGSQRNLIAPAFMISSDLGGRPGNNGVTYYNAVKRCATYQEAGYPAGRWRLPTEAELYFTYSLQRMGVIDHLYNGGAGYHASTGNIFDWTSGGNGNRHSFQAPGNGDHSIRCVYDIWYWGPDPVVTGNAVHTYYPGTGWSN